MIRSALGRLLRSGRLPDDLPDGSVEEMPYEDAKALARSTDANDRHVVAEDPNARPELLFFLARDPSHDVRLSVARHANTPRQADLLLAVDESTEIRTLVAEKITSQIRSVSQDEASQIWQLTVSILEALARDDLVKVRQLVAETARGLKQFPHHVALSLAKDKEVDVAEPALAYPGHFVDEELLEIVNGAHNPRIIGAIARRPFLSSKLVRAIVKNGDEAAISILLNNKTAEFTPDTLTAIASNKTLDRDATPVLVVTPAAEDPSVKARRLHTSNALNEDLIIDAIGLEHDFVVAALSLKAEERPEVIRKILSGKSAKGLTALAWKAGYSTRLALQLQLKLARLPPKARLTSSGGAWPLTSDEMSWQIEFFRELAQRA